jgi:hypothetical protein
LDSKDEKVGPTLFAAGDKFSRRELIDAVLTPSANIAIGYGTTIVNTRDGDVTHGVIKDVCLVRRGENHGWNVYEGFEPFSSRYRKSSERYVPPVFAYPRRYGNSVTAVTSIAATRSRRSTACTSAPMTLPSASGA